MAARGSAVQEKERGWGHREMEGVGGVGGLLLSPVADKVLSQSRSLLLPEAQWRADDGMRCSSLP